ncbi:MAG TPA: hypothetical protein VFP78_02500 [Solirubrobacteraceae bacterium]|nr:hypothetical protein [Solirubrobacteraceae bacterium]
MADPGVTQVRPRDRLRRAWDPALAACVALLVAFPVVASVTADELPRPPGPATAIEMPEGGGARASLRDVPVFSAEPDLTAELAGADAMGDAVQQGLTDALGAQRGGALLRIARDSGVDVLAVDSIAVEDTPYPFRYPPIDRVLAGADVDRQAASDVGALLVLAAAQEEGADTPFGNFPNAARVAFALLDRARAGGDCGPQLNLAFVLSADRNPRDDDVAREYEAAARACGGDPTPLWLLGQFQSQRAFAYDDDDRAGQQLERADRLRRPFATFRRMQRAWPRSSLGWAGEADAELRLAYQTDPRQPFGARRRFRRALALYRTARGLDDDPALAAGEARALAGLRRYAEAADVQAKAVAGAAYDGPPRARQVEYLERALRWSEAADAAVDFTAAPAFAPPRALFPKIAHDDNEALLFREDAEGPVSTGSDRLWPVRLEVGPPPGGAGGAGSDLSFLPLYRAQPAVTGYDRWCPDWAQRRDLVLAGRADEALDGLPNTFFDVRPWESRECPLGLEGVPLLRALAQLEAGDRGAALATAKRFRFGGDRAPAAILADAHQDLWRFGGRRDRAARAAARWVDELPEDPDASDRAGEIAFLAGDYAGAERSFARAVRTARAAYGGWTTREARSLLKRGVALSRLGEVDRALAVLEEADGVATRMEGFARNEPNRFPEGDGEAVWFSYHARAQAGDAALRARRYPAAADYYDTAAERLPRLEFELPLFTLEPLIRTEVFHNNRALAELKAGRLEPALEAARTAVAADPANPLFRETEGFALQRLGRDGDAVAAYRSGLASDPTVYPAWNDLGVLLLQQGHADEAVDALRRAVGARDDYATGWFNLGVAEEDRSLPNPAAAEGAFGKAFALDERLRDRPRDPIADDAVYITQLDLSKPLPAEWSFNRTQERAPLVAGGFAVVFLLGLRLARGLAAQGAAANPAARMLDPARRWLDRLPGSLRFAPAAVAVAATIAIFVWPLVRAGGASLASVLLLAAGVGLLIAVAMRARQLVARGAGVELEQRTWGPAVAFGAVTAAVGVPWAPVPVARTRRPAPAVHWIGPILLAGAALVLLVLAAWLQVPVTRTLGAAALVMAASMLVPIEPLDGAAVANGTGTAVTLALVGTGVLMLVGLV